MRRLIVPATAVGLAAGQLAYRLPLLTSRQFDPDELEHAHVAWSITQGHVPYRDFFEMHTPLFHYLLAGFFTLVGTGGGGEQGLHALFAARMLTWGISLGIIALTFVLARRLRDTTTAWVAVVLLTSSIVMALRAIEIRPDGLSTVLWLGALVAFHSALVADGRRSGPRFGLTGVLFGLGVMTSQKVLFGGPAIALVAAWYAVDSRFGSDVRDRVIRLGWIAAGAVLVWSAVLLAFAAQGAAGDFLYRTLFNVSRWRSETTARNILTFVLRYDPWLLALTWGGLMIAAGDWVGRPDRETRAARAVLILPAVVAFGGLFIIPVPYAQYCLTFIPLFAVLSATLIVETIRVAAGERPPWGAVPLLAIVGPGAALAATGLAVARPFVFTPALFPILLVLTVTCVLLIGRLGRPEWAVGIAMVFLTVLPLQWSRWMRDTGDGGQFAALRYVMTHTAPDAVVLDGWSGLGVFRPHAEYYWMLHPGVRAMLDQSQVDHFVGDIASGRVSPAVVILDQDLRQLSPALVAAVEARYRSVGVSGLYAKATSDAR
jgi:4-amino-4-deoxy-L-arabinose transferase-like glycosyltransferase